MLRVKGRKDTVVQMQLHAEMKSGKFRTGRPQHRRRCDVGVARAPGGARSQPLARLSRRLCEDQRVNTRCGRLRRISRFWIAQAVKRQHRCSKAQGCVRRCVQNQPAVETHHALRRRAQRHVRREGLAHPAPYLHGARIGQDAAHASRHPTLQWGLPTPL